MEPARVQLGSWPVGVTIFILFIIIVIYFKKLLVLTCVYWVLD